MPNRYYSSTAGLMQLVSPVTSAATTVVVDAVGGLPSIPFTLVLDPGVPAEEIVTVTEVSGTTLTVVRAEDGTSAVSHSAGAAARHMFSARDATEFAAHMDATQGVHGLGPESDLVGTTTAQTLEGKSMDGLLNTFTNLPGDQMVPGSITDEALGPDIDADTVGGVTFYIQGTEPVHSGPAGSGIWYVTT